MLPMNNVIPIVEMDNATVTYILQLVHMAILVTFLADIMGEYMHPLYQLPAAFLSQSITAGMHSSVVYIIHTC